jgi:arginine-tRNA-protein transferase
MTADAATSKPTKTGWEDFLFVIDQGLLPEDEDHSCTYLPDQSSRNEGFVASGRVEGEFYHELLNRGFRRSGSFFYRPVCTACSACRSIRVPVQTFAPSKSQRRNGRRNADLAVTVDFPHLSDEKWRLFQAYLARQHNRSMGDSREDLQRFLYDSPTDSLEFEYRLAGQLIAFGIGDVCSRSLSTVYFVFDPQHAHRGLGTFSMLWEIEYCRRNQIPYHYLGFAIRDCAKMNYKTNFRPYEVLSTDGAWQRIDKDPINSVPT